MFTRVIFNINYPFPKGDNASINRIKAHLKGLYDHHCVTEVWCTIPNGFRPLKRVPIKNSTVVNMAPLRNFRNDLFSKSYTLIFTGLTTFVYLCYYRLRNEKLIFYIYFTEFFYTNILFLLLCKIFNYKVVLELTDHPFPGNESSFYRFLFKSTVRRFNAVFVISTNLAAFLMNEMKINSEKVLLLPINVDTTRFESHIPLPDRLLKILPAYYIGYCGSVNEEKEGILTMLKVFSDISKEFDQFKFCIAGRGVKEDVERLQNEIIRLKLTDKVIFWERLPSKYIPYFLLQSKVLVLYRTNNIRAQFGFPTKLGEYLMAGKPVVLTDVGDISKYMKDGYNSYVSDISAEAFKEKLREALLNDEKSIEVARRGKWLAESEFSHEKISQKLLENLQQVYIGNL